MVASNSAEMSFAHTLKFKLQVLKNIVYTNFRAYLENLRLEEQNYTLKNWLLVCVLNNHLKLFVIFHALHERLFLGFLI